jgi:DNA-binding transcriptional MerR regulator
MFKTKKARPEASSPGKTFSSADVSRLSGVSLRQLQWWDERKVVSPRHQGHRRIYGLEEMVEIAVIAELRRKGFSLQKIRRVLRFLQREMGKRLTEIFAAASARPNYRHLQECPPADVPGLCDRPAEPPGGGSGAHPQAGGEGIGRAPGRAGCLTLLGRRYGKLFHAHVESAGRRCKCHFLKGSGRRCSRW